MHQDTTRRDFLKAAAAATFLSSSLRPTGAGERTGRRSPNILFCLADDWSWPHASIAGDKMVQTPTFDRVAREGVLFTTRLRDRPLVYAVARLDRHRASGTGGWRREGTSGAPCRPSSPCIRICWSRPAITSASPAKAGGRDNSSRAAGNAIRRDPRTRTFNPSSRPSPKTLRSVSGSAATIRIAPTNGSPASRAA